MFAHLIRLIFGIDCLYFIVGNKNAKKASIVLMSEY
jgi:hypothetical protein